MIINQQQLFHKVDEVSRGLQEIESYLKRTNTELPINKKIKFPRGVVRTAESFRKKIPTVKNPTIKSNMAYAMMVTDVIRWILNRTDLDYTPKDMLIKEGIGIWGALSETLTKDFLQNQISKRRSYQYRNLKLKELGYFDGELENDLNWLWDVRNKNHIFLVDHSEHCYYKVTDYNKAINTFRSLRLSLNTGI